MAKKVIILFLIFSSIFILNTAYAERCNLVWPEFGTIECIKEGNFSYIYDSNPDNLRHRVDGTVNCTVKNIKAIEGYSDEIPPIIINSLGNPDKLKPTNLVNYLPSAMNVGESYSYIYTWGKTKIRDLENPQFELIGDVFGNETGFCMSSGGKIRVISIFRLDKEEGCNLLPNKYVDNAECCWASDCENLLGDKVCDMYNFKCIQKSCDDDETCQQYGWDTCENKIDTYWACDKKQHLCKRYTKKTECCGNSDCDANSVCVWDKYFCKPNSELKECPLGKCCVLMGAARYKENMNCPAKISCCTDWPEQDIGVCAEDCLEVRNSIPIPKEKEGNSKIFIYILPIIIILGIILFLLLRRKFRKKIIRY